MTNFPNVRPALAATLTARGYTVLTPVQEAVLAPGLDVVDLLVSAQTGSGKTVAFGLALAPTLLGESNSFAPTKAPLAVVIAPTRELALQVKRELEWLYKDTGARLATCVGGMDMRDERKVLGRGVHIVVGTPGRLCDHIKRGSLDMRMLKAIVLDEADEMLKMGFREELELILTAAPEDRRTLMFSATVPKTIIGMTKKYQKNAVRINPVAQAKQHLDIAYRALNVAKTDQENAIINVLRYYDAKNAIVFCDTRVAVNRMTSRFNNRGLSVVSLSGELSQNERSHALQSLRDGRAKVCIATDVASRGLDLPDLELVIHATMPKNAEGLLHRSGRTGRAGRKGVSVLIVPHAGRKRVERLFSAARIKAEWAAPPSADEVLGRDDERLLEKLALSEPTAANEREIVEKLLAAHTPEQITTAFVRQYRATHTAPEELMKAERYNPKDSHGSDRGASAGPRKSRGRSDFENSVWFSLNLGRKQKAEPRWILPMLCKSGGLNKKDIGAIKISEAQSFVEIAQGAVDDFITEIGPEGKIEKAITAHQLDGPPDFSAADSKPQYKPRDKSTYKKKSGKRPDRFEEEMNQDTAPEFKPAAPKKGGKKPHKKKLARAAARLEKENAQSKGKSEHEYGHAPKGKPAEDGGEKLIRRKRKK
ncbi:MAG: ATP-dependent RNA helicase [Robiginitomaculum sp.]|nr:MAG: ATP-dependent RNA helicase [Robiginitomaculum sp.]